MRQTRQVTAAGLSASGLYQTNPTRSSPLFGATPQTQLEPDASTVSCTWLRRRASRTLERVPRSCVRGV